jgi:hypothetical protein
MLGTVCRAVDGKRLGEVALLDELGISRGDSSKPGEVNVASNGAAVVTMQRETADDRHSTVLEIVGHKQMATPSGRRTKVAPKSSTGAAVFKLVRRVLMRHGKEAHDHDLIGVGDSATPWQQRNHKPPRLGRLEPKWLRETHVLCFCFAYF